MNLVFSFDEGYAETFRVLMYSIFRSHPGAELTVYLLHNEMPVEVLANLRGDLEAYGYVFAPINCRDYLGEYDDFLINRYYTVEMYLWLFAPYLLPEDVDRALYLDPDIINVNRFESFYHQDFDGNCFIAMDYKIKNQIIQPINNLRLGTRSAEHYFNTGVVLMNIDRLRVEGNSEEIVEAVIENQAILILPDQDVFNHLYHGKIKRNDWELYNLDPRLYQVFHMVSSDIYHEGWVDDYVVFIHYAGKHKPWLEREKYKFDLGAYYFEAEKSLNELYIEREREVLNGETF